jgi:hypothetical protein
MELSPTQAFLFGALNSDQRLANSFFASVSSFEQPALMMPPCNFFVAVSGNIEGGYSVDGPGLIDHT